jgi:carboxylesterase type B
VSSTATIAYPNKTANFDRIVGKFLGQGGIIGEDCLTLNIWAKHAASSFPNSTEQRKAVMVFFHGGSGYNSSFTAKNARF